MTAAGAVVVGGDYRGLGIVRSLGRQGVPVWVVHGSDAIARQSRYCTAAFHVPDEDPAALMALLRRLGVESGLHDCVLFPTSDETAWVVSRHRGELATWYRHAVPPWEVYSAASDKRQVYAIAAALGLQTPRCWFLDAGGGPDDVTGLGITEADFPLVIKPARRQRLNALTSAKAWRADDRDELSRRLREALALMPADQIMIQELIPGNGLQQYAVGAVSVAGEPRYIVAARRTRQYPREFGRASCFVETIDHPDLVKDAARLIAELGIDGLVEVEFKQDEATGAVKLLDVNARAWGWHSIGAAAGVDFAHAAYRVALGERLPLRTGRPGVRWSRLAIDLPYAIAEVVGGRTRPADLLRSLRPPLEGPIAAYDDPLPAVMEIPLLLRTALRKGHAGRARS